MEAAKCSTIAIASLGFGGGTNRFFWWDVGRVVSVHLKRSCSEARIFCSEYCNGNLSIKFEASVHYCDAPAFGHQSSIPVKSRSTGVLRVYIYVVVQETLVNEVRWRT